MIAALGHLGARGNVLHVAVFRLQTFHVGIQRGGDVGRRFFHGRMQRVVSILKQLPALRKVTKEIGDKLLLCLRRRTASVQTHHAFPRGDVTHVTAGAAADARFDVPALLYQLDHFSLVASLEPQDLIERELSARVRNIVIAPALQTFQNGIVRHLIKGGDVAAERHLYRQLVDHPAEPLSEKRHPALQGIRDDPRQERTGVLRGEIAAVKPDGLLDEFALAVAVI